MLALQATSAYRFRCWFACVDQTSTQNDYVEQRDRCRKYAQLRSEVSIRSAGNAASDQSRKSELVSLFSKCMEQNGWTISEVKDKDKSPAPAPVQPQPGQATAAAVAPTQPDPAYQKASLSRSAECAFARHAASASSRAAARAAACDLECAQRLKASPDAPRPAACPSGPTPDLSKGRDKE